MIIGKRNIKQLKLFIVSHKIQKFTLISYLILMPLFTFFEQFQYSSQPIDTNYLQRSFNLNLFLNCKNNEDIFNFFQEQFLPQYFKLKDQYIPVQQFMILQQRDKDYINCTYHQNQQTTIVNQNPDQSLCVETGCGEFSNRSNLHNEGENDQITVQGQYLFYDQLNFFTMINIDSNSSDIIGKLQQNKWIDQQTQVLIFLASVFDLRSHRQIQIIFISESPFNKETLNLEVRIHQLKVLLLDDGLHSLLLISIITVVLLMGFRTLLEIAYNFSSFLVLTQLMHFTVLIAFIQTRLSRIVLSSQDDELNLIYDQKQFYESFGATIFGPLRFLNIYQYLIEENIILLAIWIIYPLRLIYFGFWLFQANWYRSYFNILFRMIPSISITMLIFGIFYFGGILQINFLQIVYNENAVQNALLCLFSGTHLDHSISSNEWISRIFDYLKSLFLMILMIYFLSIFINSFQKGNMYQLPYEKNYELELKQQIEQINMRVQKLLKEVLRVIPKDKKKVFSKNSQIIDDELFCFEETQKSLEKILIVYEIQNSYLDEIQQYQDKKDMHKPLQNNKKQAPKTKGISSKEVTLQNMLSKYKNGSGDYIQVSDENEGLDFFQEFSKDIEERGITIRSFCIVDQVIKFLKMLIQLRLEFLSPNAEQRIRIFFFINSDQVSETDVYKMLSYLIINLKKNHLTYPILIFSHHKDWYIEKQKYIQLKKFYKNIFSTLDIECALLFSYMTTSFLDLENRFAQYQTFDQKVIKIDSAYEDDDDEDNVDDEDDDQISEKSQQEYD